jgi:ABC-type multidrug transport system ATPase subunit
MLPALCHTALAAGYAEPGVLMALMGGSGAGKTTLMDVLAGRKTQGVIKGDLMINGHPKVQETWARVVGYVEQVDIHSAGLTVEESLQFSAGLRLTDDVAANTRQAYILEVRRWPHLRARVIRRPLWPPLWPLLWPPPCGPHTMRLHGLSHPNLVSTA